MIGPAVALIVLSALFALIERRPSAIFRRERRIDFIYWFFTPIVSRSVTAIALFIVFALLGLAARREGAPWFRAQSLPLQAIEVLVAADLIAYATHRMFHRQPLWRIHAIHHSSVHLDWLAAARVHPLNEAFTRIAQAVPLYLLGFDGKVIAGAVPLLTLYAILLHANVSWDFGPLRYVIASPRFHRWHHTAEDDGLDKNFAGLFPWLDVLFGTFYLPEREPAKFGIRETIPAGLIGQLAHPFRKT